MENGKYFEILGSKIRTAMCSRKVMIFKEEVKYLVNQRNLKWMRI